MILVDEACAIREWCGGGGKEGCFALRSQLVVWGWSRAVR